MAKSTENQKITKTTCDTVRTNGDALRGLGRRLEGIRRARERERREDLCDPLPCRRRPHGRGANAHYRPVRASDGRQGAGDGQAGAGRSRGGWRSARRPGCVTRRNDRRRVVRPLPGRRVRHQKGKHPRHGSRLDRTPHQAAFGPEAAFGDGSRRRGALFVRRCGREDGDHRKNQGARQGGGDGRQGHGYSHPRPSRGDPGFCGRAETSRRQPCSRRRAVRGRTCDRFLSPAELGRLGAVLEAMEGEGVHPYGLAIIRLLAFTGARRSEISALRGARSISSGESCGWRIRRPARRC